MSAISHTPLVMSGLMPMPQEFSFYELRIAEQQVINPAFENMGAGWWRYDLAGFCADVFRPSWDKGYDWDGEIAKVMKRWERPAMWLGV